MISLRWLVLFNATMLGCLDQPWKEAKICERSEVDEKIRVPYIKCPFAILQSFLCSWRRHGECLPALQVGSTNYYISTCIGTGKSVLQVSMLVLLLVVGNFDNGTVGRIEVEIFTSI